MDLSYKPSDISSSFGRYFIGDNFYFVFNGLKDEIIFKKKESTGKDDYLQSISIDTFLNDISSVYNVINYKREYTAVLKNEFISVLDIFIAAIPNIRDEYKLKDRNRLLLFFDKITIEHNEFIKIVSNSKKYNDLSSVDSPKEIKEYYKFSNAYLTFLKNENNWNIIRSNYVFPSDEEEEMKLVYKYEKKLDEDLSYIGSTSHPTKNEYRLRIKSINDFLLERYNFEEAFRLMATLKPFGKILYAINCPQVIILLILIILLSYPTNIIILLQAGLFGILGLGFFYTIAYPLFYLFFRHRSAFHDLSLIAPKFIISILIGWVALLPFADEIWRLNKSTIDAPGLFASIICTLGVIIYSFIFYELKMVKPFITPRESFSRIIRLFSIGFSVSIFAGLLFMSFSFIPNVGESKFYIDNVASSRLIRDVEKIESEYKRSVEKYYALSYLRQEKDLDSIKKRLLFVNNSIKDSIKIQKMDIIRAKYYIDSSYYVALESAEILFKEKKEKIYNKLCEYENKEWTKKGNNSFCCMNILNVMNLYIFPKLLLLMSLTTFLLGYFIQFVFEGRSLRKN